MPGGWVASVGCVRQFPPYPPAQLTRPVGRCCASLAWAGVGLTYAQLTQLTQGIYSSSFSSVIPGMGIVSLCPPNGGSPHERITFHRDFLLRLFVE